MSFYRLLFCLAACLAAGGCAGLSPDNAPINMALSTPAAAADSAVEPPPFGDTAVGLSFSGGGTRAAALAHGVLSALADQSVRGEYDGTLAERVVFVSGVSGGSVAAAYFAHRGPLAVRDFREKFLIQDVESALRTRVTPANVIRAFEGGVNDRTGLPRWLDQNLFGGATYGDIRRRDRPILWINASDIYNRNVFIFDDWTFSVLCSDLSRYPLSEAVAASAAVPIAFAPIIVRNYAQDCAYQQPAWVDAVLSNREGSATLRAYAEALQVYRNPARMPQVSLLDGGITDNLGVYGLTVARGTAEHAYQPMTPESAARLRNMLFVVVDAGRGPEGDWPTRPGGPTGTQVAMATVDTMIGANIRYTYDAFNQAMERWRQDLVAWRCRLSGEEVRRYRGTTANWNCRDLNFHVVRVSFDAADPALRERLDAVQTNFRLPTEEVDMVIRAGYDILRSDPTYREFVGRVN